MLPRYTVSVFAASLWKKILRKASRTPGSVLCVPPSSGFARPRLLLWCHLNREDPSVCLEEA